MGESIGVRPDGGFVLVEFEVKGHELLLELGKSFGKGVRVSVEGEVVWVDIHSRVWIGVSHLVFHCGHRSPHCQWEDEARHRASLGQAPFHGVSDDLVIVKFTCELVTPP